MPLILRTKEEQAKLDSLNTRWLKLIKQKAKIEAELKKIDCEREEILYKGLGLKLREMKEPDKGGNNHDQSNK